MDGRRRFWNEDMNFMDDTRNLGLLAHRGDTNDKLTAASVTFCEGSASLQIEGLTVHIPWVELAEWQVWLANRIEKEL